MTPVAEVFQSSRIEPTLLGVWFVAMAALPIADRFGAAARVRTLSCAVLSQLVIVLYAYWSEFGFTTVAFLSVTIPTFGWIAEFVGTRTGLPFGPYVYTDRLQPQVRNVPLLIPAAWLMMLPVCWSLTAALVPRAGTVVRAAVAAFAFTAWDLFLDPLMVRWDYWRWRRGGRYQGIPWTNFLGWWLWSCVIGLATGAPVAGNDILSAIYIVTWALFSIGQLVLWRMPIAALAGGTAMGLFALPRTIALLLP